jgi:hypothetical protein
VLARSRLAHTRSGHPRPDLAKAGSSRRAGRVDFDSPGHGAFVSNATADPAATAVGHRGAETGTTPGDALPIASRGRWTLQRFERELSAGPTLWVG